MNIGRLRHQVSIQRMNLVKDDISGGTLHWSTIPIATVWAAIEPMRSKELIALKTVHAEVTHKITMRYLQSFKIVPGKYRIQFGTRYFSISSVINPDERNISYEILASEDMST